jgi:hypothetical protein
MTMGLTMMGMLAVAVLAGDSPSLTDTPARKRPGLAGVPLIVSVAPFADAVSPSGSPVVGAHVYGPTPPDTVTVPEYSSSPTTVNVGTSVKILNDGTTMPRLTKIGMRAVADDSPSLTDTPARKRPGSAGVPLIVSVAPFAIAVSP